MTPIIVRALGNHDYGIWEILMALIGYMGLLELGLQPAIIRNVAKLNALNNRIELDKIYSSSLFFLGTVGLVSSIILFSWALIYPDAIAETGGSLERYTIFLMIAGLNVFITFTGHVFQCFHQGFQHYHMINKIRAIVHTIIANIILYVFLQKGYGLITIISISTIASIIRITLFWVLLRSQKFGGFRFSFNNISIRSMRDLLNFGIKSFFLGITSRVSNATDSIVIGLILNPTIVAFYIIPVNLVRKARNLIFSITLGFMPFFSELHARGDKIRIKETFLVSSRYVAGICILLFWGTILLGAPFLARWIGPEYAEKGKIVLYIISIAYLLPLLNPFHGRLLTSAGRHGFLAKIRSFGAFLNLILSIILIFYFGKEGVALGTLIPLLIIEPLILKYVCKYVGIRVMEYLKSAVFPQAIPSLGCIITYQVISMNLKIHDYFSILLTACSLSLIYVLLFFAFSIPRAELKTIASQFKAKVSFIS